MAELYTLLRSPQLGIRNMPWPSRWTFEQTTHIIHKPHKTRIGLVLTGMPSVKLCIWISIKINIRNPLHVLLPFCASIVRSDSQEDNLDTVRLWIIKIMRRVLLAPNKVACSDPTLFFYVICEWLHTPTGLMALGVRNVLTGTDARRPRSKSSLLTVSIASYGTYAVVVTYAMISLGACPARLTNAERSRLGSVTGTVRDTYLNRRLASQTSVAVRLNLSARWH
jgi:hypothetical protein